MNSDSTEDSAGALASGSANNVRWQVTNRDTSTGTFDMVIRQGNDNSANPIILETWTGLSLDPTAPNFISRVIGDSYQDLDTVNNQMVSYGTYKNKVIHT